MDSLSYILAAQRQLAEEAAVRELEREMAFAEHTSQALALVEDMGEQSS